jgi:MurE/MurF fusion protein
MTLRDLIAGLEARVIGDLGVAVGMVRGDSRAVEPGDVFVAVRGLSSDGHDFVAGAIERGAAAIVVERELAASVPQVIVGDGAVALGVLTGRAFGDPARAMTLVAVTGTNGKTTTTYLVEAILAAAGHRPGVIGTVELRWPGTTIPAAYTTPTPYMLHEALAKMRDAGCTHVVMEVTSIALAAKRVAGLEFAVAAFSNLTQDHLDFHGTMEAYRDAKRLLFTDHLAGTAVVNLDDPAGEVMMVPGRTLRVTSDATRASAEIRVVANDSTVRGIWATIATPRGDVALQARPLIGHYNVANLALATGIAEALRIPHEAIARGIASLPGVPGRVERVANDADLDIFVDYAHTPDALHNVLSALRPLTRRRLICVFGCGGDRDPTKRPKMGAAVAELADLAVVTSDNPRTEDPRAIIDQILPAVPGAFYVDVDRRVAIRAAIAEATPGDVVVIAGKGHEDYQILGTTKHHFDDREEARAAVLDRWRRSLRALADDVGGELRPASADDGFVTRVVIDSRIAAPGDLYVAIRGERSDGHAFCADAIRAGARAVLVDTEAEPLAELRERAAVIVVSSASSTGAPTPPGEPGPGLAPPEPRSGNGEAGGSTASGARAGGPGVDATRRALGAIAHGHRQRWPGKLVAITGSAGKTTTKELTRAALAMAAPTHAGAGSLNNETGVPLTLLGLRPFHAFGVVEMGMRGRGQIDYLTRLAEPDVAVVVNAGTAHLELLGSTAAIAEAKAEIWLGLRAGGTVVRPADDDRLERWARTHQPRARHVTFGDGIGDVQLVDYAARATGSELVLDGFGTRHELALALVGRHAALDACAALAAAHAAGASIEQAIAGLARARPPALRGEIVEVAGRHVIVDCYNANPASMAAALRALAERARGTGLAIIGDMLELGDHATAAHREVGALVRELGLGAIALGDHAATVVTAAGADAELAATPQAAATRALARTSPGDWILLKASRGMRLERVLAAMRGQKDAG